MRLHFQWMKGTANSQKNQSLFTNILTHIKNKFSYNMKQTDSKCLNLNRRYKKYKNRDIFMERCIMHEERN